MHFELFFKGIITGLLVSLPLGPLAILVIQRTANRDFKSGFYTGLGVALTDTFWALVSGFGLAYIIAFLKEHQSIIQLIGAVFIFLLGLHIFNSHPIQSIRKFRRKGTNPWQCFFSASLIALSNPMVLLVYIAVLASANLVFNINHLATPFVFASGFLMGALSWWTIITLVVNRFRHHFNIRILWWFNKISGLAIMLFVVVTSIILLIKGSPSI